MTFLRRALGGLGGAPAGGRSSEAAQEQSSRHRRLIPLTPRTPAKPPVGVVDTFRAGRSDEEMSDREPADEAQDEQAEQDGAGEKEQPDQEQVLQEREERLDPDNRPDNVEVDNTDRTFDPETGFFEDREEHDSAPKQFVDEEGDLRRRRLERRRLRRLRRLHGSRRRPGAVRD
jgi:hypothetical protein